MTTDTTLDRLKAICEAATSGPWESWHKDMNFSAGWGNVDFGPFDANVHDHNQRNIGAIWNRKDAEFIAAARTAMPLLIELIEALDAFYDYFNLRELNLLDPSEMQSFAQRMNAANLVLSARAKLEALAAPAAEQTAGREEGL